MWACAWAIDGTRGRGIFFRYPSASVSTKKLQYQEEEANEYGDNEKAVGEYLGSKHALRRRRGLIAMRYKKVETEAEE